MSKEKKYWHRNMRPPLGVMPEHIWREKRFDDLNSARVEYVIHGKIVPAEWYEEMEEHRNWLQAYKNRRPKRPKYKIPQRFFDLFGGNKPAPEPMMVDLTKKKEWAIRKAIVTVPTIGPIHMEENDTLNINVFADEPAHYVPLNIEQAVKSYNGEIKSVRRESDQEVFDVGDVVDYCAEGNEYKDFGTGEIIKIVPEASPKSGLFVYINDKEEDYTPQKYIKNIRHTQKRKEPLLTTEDGVRIFDELAMIYMLYEKEWQTNELPANVLTDNAMPAWTKYSSKEARDEYILNNQPCLSMRDVIDSTIMSTTDGGWLVKVNHLKNIAKEKLKLK